MIQIKKTILTLVALLAVTTGAWADGTVTVTEIKASEMPTSWGNYDNPVKATDLPGFTAVTRDDAKALGAPAAEGDIYVFYAISNNVFMGLHWNNGVLDDSDGGFSLGGIYALQDVFKFYYVAAPPSGPEVAWDKAEKTGKFTMPGGNVTLEPEYYPQATVADGGVTAADADARATTDDPLVKVDATKLTGAKKLMYFVSNSGTTAPAYDAEGWTDQLPTAEGFTQQGIVYVWYYPVGIDEGVDGATATYSDGDICLQSITARIAAAPTYDVTFAEGTDPNEWKADPAAGVTKGQTVTVTYTGTKKVIGVKAEKKAAKPAAEGHALSASVVGEIVGSDGNVYAVADKDNLPEGVTAVAMVAYKSETTGSSLAIALADEGSMNWNSAKSTCASKAAIGGKSWKLPTKDEWEQMFSANGGSTGLKTALSAAGGASSTLQNGYCWSSTEVVIDPEDDPDMAWIYSFGEGRWYWDDMGNGRQVRACLAF